MIRHPSQNEEESIFCSTAWGRGAYVAPNPLPDFFPKPVRSAWVSCGFSSPDFEAVYFHR